MDMQKFFEYGSGVNHMFLLQWHRVVAFLW